MLLEIGCGSGHSLRYQHRHGAKELWGIFSQGQLDNAARLLRENDCEAKLICTPMEEEAGISAGYFDCVYSVHASGWTPDLVGAFRRIAGYLKPDGRFLFSWKHTMHFCIDNRTLQLTGNYFDEDWHDVDMGDGLTASICSRKISTYVNALYETGFVVKKWRSRRMTIW